MAHVCFSFLFEQFAISGARKPGVPHLTKRCYLASSFVASPKSIIKHSSPPYFYLIIMFSSLRSLWMIFFFFIYERAKIIYLMYCFCFPISSLQAHFCLRVI